MPLRSHIPGTLDPGTFAREPLYPASWPQPEMELINAIGDALGSFDLKRTSIMELAFAQGGADLVVSIQKARDALDDAYYELVLWHLDSDHQHYLPLIDQAKSATEEIRKEIASFKTISEIIQRFGKAVDVIRRLLIVLGI